MFLLRPVSLSMEFKPFQHSFRQESVLCSCTAANSSQVAGWPVQARETSQGDFEVPLRFCRRQKLQPCTYTAELRVDNCIKRGCRVVKYVDKQLSTIWFEAPKRESSQSLQSRTLKIVPALAKSWAHHRLAGSLL